MTNPTPNVELIEGTIVDLDDTIDRLMRERTEIDRRLTEVRTRQSEWRRILSKTSRNGSEGRRRRAKKGENRKKIMDHFVTLGPNAACTMADIADATDIAWSSVRNELSRDNGGFREGVSGLWHLMQDADSPTARVPHS